MRFPFNIFFWNFGKYFRLIFYGLDINWSHVKGFCIKTNFVLIQKVKNKSGVDILEMYCNPIWFQLKNKHLKNGAQRKGKTCIGILCIGIIWVNLDFTWSLAKPKLVPNLKINIKSGAQWELEPCINVFLNWISMIRGSLSGIPRGR